jgi:integrase
MARKAAGKRIDMLSARYVEGVKKPGLFGDGGNLFLKVDERGNKSWIFKWQAYGKPEKMGLGALRTVSLAEARNKAEAARKLVHDGIDPRVARREAKQAVIVAEAKLKTFDECRDDYIEAHKAGWKNDKHAAQWKATLETYASSIFGSLPVKEVDTGLVMRVLSPIWASKNETAHRVRGRIESVLSWAKVHGYRRGGNPARWRGHIDQLLPKRSKVHKVEHHAALPYDEMPAFMRDLRKRDGVAALALEFAILTATRTSETLNAVYSEIDLKNKLWTIPAERMKGDREHRVPLSDRAVAIIEDMKTDKRGDFIFPGAKRGKPLSNMSMLTVLRRMKRGDLTSHGFRSSFRTWASERTNFQREIAEKALAHLVGDETERAYDRGDLFDKRRRLMNAWAAYCETKPHAKTGDNVTALRS